MNATPTTPSWGMTRVLGWGAAGVVALTAVTGIAEATSRTATSEAPAAAQQAAAPAVQPAVGGAVAAASVAQAAATEPQAGKRKDCPCRRQAARRPVHGEFVVPVKDGFRTVQVQRGEVTGSKAGSLAVKSADGYTATWTVDKDAKVRKAGKQVALTEVKVGDRVFVRGPKTDAGATARIVRAHTPKQAAQS